MHRVAMIALACLLGLASVFVWLPRNAAAGGNGIQSPAPGAAVRGAVTVRALADDPQFAKWQLDLLPAGAADQVTFLALGEQPQVTAADLAVLDTTRFRDGTYTLRLRVVRRDGNYDEYANQIVIANAVASSPPPSTSRGQRTRAPAGAFQGGAAGFADAHGGRRADPVSDLR